MSLLDILLTSLVVLTLDIDVALYQSSRVQAAAQDQQRALVNWVLLIEFVLRFVALALVLFVFSGPDEELFEVFGVSISTSGLMMLVAGAFVFFSSSIELGELLAESAEASSGPNSKPLPFRRMVIEMSAVSLLMGVDTVVAIVAATDSLLDGAVILLTATVIRGLVVNGFASYMRRNPSLKLVTSTFLILVGITLILQGVQIDFPVEGFGLGLIAAITAQMVYKRRTRDRRSQAEASGASREEA